MGSLLGKACVYGLGQDRLLGKACVYGLEQDRLLGKACVYGLEQDSADSNCCFTSHYLYQGDGRVAGFAHEGDSHRVAPSRDDVRPGDRRTGTRLERQGFGPDPCWTLGPAAVWKQQGDDDTSSKAFAMSNASLRCAVENTSPPVNASHPAGLILTWSSLPTRR